MTDKLLNYSEKYNCIFVRIARCATSSICKALDISGGHYTYSELQLMLPKNILKKAVIFTVVRNPWDRVVSLFKFRITRGWDTSHFENEEVYLINWLQKDSIKADFNLYQDLQQFPYWAVGRPDREVPGVVKYIINYDHLEFVWKNSLPGILGVSNLPDLLEINTAQQILERTECDVDLIKYEENTDNSSSPHYTTFYKNKGDVEYIGELFWTEINWLNWKFDTISNWAVGKMPMFDDDFGNFIPIVMRK